MQIQLETKKIVELLADSELGSFTDIAKFLDVSPRTIYTWINKSAIPHKYHKKLMDLVNENKSSKIRQVLDKVDVGQLIRAIEKRGYVVSVESKA